LQQSRLYGKALEVARKGNHDFGAFEIGMKYLQLALEEIDKYIYRRTAKCWNVARELHWQQQF
jgi:hypothetical protein